MRSNWTDDAVETGIALSEMEDGLSRVPIASTRGLYGIFPLKGNYRLGIRKMVRVGKFDRFTIGARRLTARNFKMRKSGSFVGEVKIFNPRQSKSIDDLQKLMKRGGGFVPAKAEHILAFARRFPQIQRKKQITAVGSVGVVSGNICVLSLSVAEGSRTLLLLGYDKKKCFPESQGYLGFRERKTRRTRNKRN